ncbi:MAG TPA: aminopeptidase, partial [Lachnospiraceae bacterium]|nr:aminopeptidase [Lachnospiraceae bacterium]
FYNTLFDENAACHLALGAGFNECVEGFQDLSEEELFEKGLNDSIGHTDFMIGSDDLSIDGVTEDGKTVPIFRNGTWA